MSRSEIAQLQRRAAEAGLTVSAYLRSCTFEAEALRTQVKEALAQLRPVKPAEAVVPAPAQSLPGWDGFLALFRALFRTKEQRLVVAPERDHSISSTRHLRYSVSGKLRITG